MSVEWNSLHANEKETYNKQAEKDKVRYQNEMKGYVKKDAHAPAESKKQDKKASHGKKGQKEESEEESGEEEQSAVVEEENDDE